MKIQNSLVFDMVCPIPECKKKIAKNLIMQVSTEEMMDKFNTYCENLSYVKKHTNCLF